MKIYTRTGDAGQTSLTDGTRIPKDDVRIDAYGTVDELNSIIGLARAHKLEPELDDILQKIQNELFVVGSQLATPPGPMREKIPELPSDAVEQMEGVIDALSESLPPLTQFILPGGSHAAALLHMARTVCRRAERHTVALARAAITDPLYDRYLNRLSDLLFVAARWVNFKAEATEVFWEK
ncbi:MAG: ATP:cob(I)alamin adenosyltransferase [Candidatus Magasanikbacteria bacterium RIFCSPHIGHO2_01_FULL_50_8]|uniref:Corrinoid adenosyltransferase n=2 Tax=Candidatus Magasanikiibacteriota TaxID=1752731 RepID=A0A1F6LVW1_9BACT|nr:MAG: ATP:cob(I)alamin adenosyltransferase [Candidatus Magasanikbacteria bacterium RIFCSPHIGHO2_01_FULL_50_8]OGH67778.1 MAG: ATP:cob(I)alamin adenosyltransferase [Candidatus Magasanikbacteria bacterium RIFCSPHIGHO2_02_FULL_50_9b]